MKLGLSMWSVVSDVRAGKIDLPGFIDFAAQQQAQGVELLDFFWTDRDAEIPQVKKRSACRSGAVYSIGNDFFPDPEEPLQVK